MRYSVRAIIIFLLVIPGCKKEIVNDTGTNYFMIYLSNNASGRVTIASTRYNDNPQNIVINEDSIVFKQGGLYHFEGFILIANATRSSASYPVSYDLTMYLKGRAYTLVQGHTTASGSTDAGATNFSIDIPVQADDGIRLQRSINNIIGANAITRFSGYMIRKL